MSQHVNTGPRYKNTSSSLNYKTTGSNTNNKSQAQTHICTSVCVNIRTEKWSQTKKMTLYGETETSSDVTCASVYLRIWSHSSSHLLLTKRKSLLCSMTFPWVLWSSSLKAERTWICRSVFVYEVSVSRTHYTSHSRWRTAVAARCVLHS